MIELSLGGELPALLHPGRGRSWWWTATGPAWTDGGRLWVVRGERVLVLPLEGEVDLEPLPGGGLVAWSAAGEVVHVGRAGAPTRSHVAADDEDGTVQVRNGADIRAVRRGTDWRVQWEETDVPLPEGATRARDLRPFRRGPGVCWRSEGWLYRMAMGARPRPVAELGPEERWCVGPAGAVLLGGEGGWDRGAAPGHGVRPLPALLAGGEVRWSPDGRVVAGIDGEHTATWIDLDGGRVLETRPQAWPLDGQGRWLGRDGTLPESGWHPREASWARADELLGGPGGRVWDLASGRPITPPVLRLGVTVTTPEAWATVDWETGEGTWVDPRTGRTGPRFRIPLAADDVVRGGRVEAGVVVETAEGAHWRVEGDRVLPAEPARRYKRPEPALAAFGRRKPDLPLEGAARVGGRIYGWSTDGLLVAFPS